MAVVVEVTTVAVEHLTAMMDHVVRTMVVAVAVVAAVNFENKLKIIILTLFSLRLETGFLFILI